MADLFLRRQRRAPARALRALPRAARAHAAHARPSFEGRARDRRRQPPELLLSDLELGAERGDEELARSAHPGELPPTLVVSGYLDRELEARLAALRLRAMRHAGEALRPRDARGRASPRRSSAARARVP